MITFKNQNSCCLRKLIEDGSVDFMYLVAKTCDISHINRETLINGTMWNHWILYNYVIEEQGMDGCARIYSLWWVIVKGRGRIYIAEDFFDG